jgi:hypothetical protein
VRRPVPAGRTPCLGDSLDGAEVLAGTCLDTHPRVAVVLMPDPQPGGRTNRPTPGLVHSCEAAGGSAPEILASG